MRAAARIVAEAVAGATRCTTLHSEPPLTFRQTSAGLTWVGTAAGPIGGDDLRLVIEVRHSAALVVGSAGASIALPGTSGASSQMGIDVSVGRDASLVWHPEPLVLSGGAAHVATTSIAFEPGADVIWIDELVLGRHAERCGRLSSRLVVDGPTSPVLRSGMEIGEPGWDGPAVTDAHRAHAQIVLAGEPASRSAQLDLDQHFEHGHVRSARSDLADGAVLISIVAAEPRHMRLAVDYVSAISGSERRVRL
jgi:urease accessory protein